MIRIEDACKVCKDLIVEFGDGTMDAEMEELIHNEMEQKEWVNAKAGPASKILSSITDTIMDIHPVKIAEAIKEDKLRDWCVEMQARRTCAWTFYSNFTHAQPRVLPVHKLIKLGAQGRIKDAHQT